MGGGIAFAQIGFDLNDSSLQQFSSLAPNQHFAQQIARDFARITVVKLTRQSSQVVWQGWHERFGYVPS
jgi:hypothetical protein